MPWRTTRTQYPGIWRRIDPSGTARGWIARPRVKGAKIPDKTFDRLSDAREYLEKSKEAARERQTFGVRRETVSDAIAQYRRLELRKISDTDRRNRERQLSWWEGRLGATKLVDLRRGAIRAELDQLAEEGMRARKVSVATVNRYRAALSAVLSAAVEWEWLAGNPLHSGSRRRRALQDRERPRERELTKDEEARLWQRLKASGDARLYALVVCALASGARQGELLGMERKHLELYPQVFNPATGATQPGAPRYVLQESKTGRGRTLYFPGEAGELLRAMAKAPVLSRFVWAKAGDPPNKLPSFPTMAFRYAKRKALISNFRFHDLRHMWAAALVDRGVEVSQLMILAGWTSARMVWVYASRAQRHGNLALEGDRGGSVEVFRPRPT